jgi:hypothetical protein
MDKAQKKKKLLQIMFLIETFIIGICIIFVGALIWKKYCAYACLP